MTNPAPFFQSPNPVHDLHFKQNRIGSVSDPNRRDGHATGTPLARDAPVACCIDCIQNGRSQKLIYDGMVYAKLWSMERDLVKSVIQFNKSVDNHFRLGFLETKNK